MQFNKRFRNVSEPVGLIMFGVSRHDLTCSTLGLNSSPEIVPKHHPKCLLNYTRSVTTPGKPLKLAISLSHKYTKANLDFANLKGRDLMMADHLRSSGAFEVHLALITRHKWGQAEEDDDYGYDRWGNRGYSRSSSEASHHSMWDVCEDTVSVKKWVDETGATVNNGGIGTVPI